MKDENKTVHPYAYLFPNLFTTGNLFAGFFSIVSAMQMYFVEAAWALVIAAFLDLMDGRVARFTGATSKFGVEYDSIVDVVSFGVAPSILIYQWSFEPFGKWGIFFAFAFLACGAIRLARFNVTTGTAPKGYFQGLPIPVAAMFISTGIIFQESMNLKMSIDYLPLAFTIILSILMVSTVPYYSFKDIKFSVSGRQIFLFAIAVLLLVATIMNPEKMLFAIVSSYIVIGMIWGFIKMIKREHKGFAALDEKH